MTDMERLEQALRSVREADAGRGAPEFLETRLRAAFREQHARRPRFQWAWIGAAAVATMALFVVWRLAAPASVEAPTPTPVIAKTAPTQQVVASTTPPPKPVKPPTRRRVAPPSQRPVDAVSASTRQDDFIALPYAPPFAPTERGQVFRVRMPRQALRQLGLPMNEERIFERIPADVLLGEDGIPRAIRIVRGSETR